MGHNNPKCKKLQTNIKFIQVLHGFVLNESLWQVGIMHNAIDVACYFIKYSGYTKTHLQIQKLTYISHGYMLAIHNRPLIDDEIQAWKHGPVIPNVYEVFKKWNSRVIESIPTKPKQFEKEELEIMNTVFANYGKYCGFYLSQITHEDGDKPTPWRRCYIPETKNTISDGITQEYYKELIQEHE